MSRQHCTPILLKEDGTSSALAPLGLLRGDGAVSEADIQALVQAHPACLPIAEIDEMFVNPVPICRELSTPAGAIDNLMVTPSGLPVLVECKLWRNPEGRREVVGQILDYAKELSRWSSSDLQREVSRNLKRSGNALLELVRLADPQVKEIDFNDALTRNLRRGRFLLLIVGDGIREGVEAIAEYLHDHAGMHFSLGLVEMPIYVTPDGARVVVPRVLARTEILTRQVIAVPDGHMVAAAEIEEDAEEGETASRNPHGDEQQAYWQAFLSKLKLDDPEQPLPNPPRMGYVTFSMPARAGTSWLTVYRDLRKNEVGVFLSSSKNSAGEYAMRAIVEDATRVCAELGGTATLQTHRERPTIGDRMTVRSLADPDDRARAFAWLAERVNAFVNVMRPRVRSAAADYEQRG